ncbi:hypothetical protein [Carnimonas nigrificans]|uniref:hypothetical protein n=1 Tax=Carnimonas nigrificans TaxID=64323 RepID=UPI0004AF0731|nr:hypothetical protein [Carnimonas nigrificans]
MRITRPYRESGSACLHLVKLRKIPSAQRKATTVCMYRPTVLQGDHFSYRDLSHYRASRRKETSDEYCC